MNLKSLSEHLREYVKACLAVRLYRRAGIFAEAAGYIEDYERMRAACVELRNQLEAIRLDRDEWRDRATKYETVHTDGSTTQSDLDVLRALARHLNRVCNSAKL